MSSTVTADTLVVDEAPGRVVERQTADKQVMTVRTEGGTEERPTPDTLRCAPVLDDQQAGNTIKGLGPALDR